MLVDWFARGYNDESILVHAEQNGFGLTPDGVRRKRAELRQQTTEALAAKGGQYLREMLRANPVVRAAELEEWLDNLNTAVRWCMDNEKHQYLGKLIEVGLDVHADIRSELGELAHKPDDQEHQKALFGSFSPEKQRRIVAAWEAARDAWEDADMPRVSIEVFEESHVSDSDG